MNVLTRIEELILLAVWRLQEEAYGLEVRNHLSELLGEDLSVGAVYVPLKRLKKRGYLESWNSDPTPERGGRSKQYYRLTPQGVTALNEVNTIQQKAWSGLPDTGLQWIPAKNQVRSYEP